MVSLFIIYSVLRISSFGFNRLGSKLVGMFLEIVPMFVATDFAQPRFVGQICANFSVHVHCGAYLRDKLSDAEQNPLVRTLKLTRAQRSRPDSATRGYNITKCRTYN